MRYLSSLAIVFVTMCFCIACGSNSGTEKSGAAENNESPNATAAAVRSFLAAEDFIRLQNCSDATCVQLFMKNHSQEFMYGKKGEFASFNVSSIIDSTGSEITIPSSTVYFSTDPGADWRLTQTVHSKELADELLNDFAAKKFTLVDSFFYHATKAICYSYTSPGYPEQTLYFSQTYSPWGSKGLYLGSGWLNYVFEINRTR